MRLLKISTFVGVAILACGLSAVSLGISFGAETDSPGYKLVDLGTPGSYVSVQPIAINERGQVTGNAATAGEH